MASVDAGTKIPLWVTVGAHGAIALVLSVWMTFRLTAWKMGKPLQDLTAQSILFWGMSANLVAAVSALSLVLNQFLALRWDSVVIAYFHWIMYAIVFAIMARMVTVFLAMNRVWIDSLFYAFAASMLALVAATWVGDTGRYLWVGVHLAILLYSIHALWVYRRRSDFHALFVLAWIQVVWVLGYPLPFILGHACLQIISFKIEIWWYSAAGWIGVGFLTLYLARNVFRLGKGLEEFFESGRYKIFSSRLSEVGCPGEDLFANVIYLPTTVDKQNQDQALETGRPAPRRQPAAVLVPEQQVDNDYGVLIGEPMMPHLLDIPPNKRK